MDDRNGDCFEHHEDLYGDVALNTSDSEHECLKEFLLEPRDSLRNVPCLGNEIADGSHLGNQNTSIENVNYENSVNSTDERLEEDGIPPNCVQDSCSSTAFTTNSDDEEKNGEYFSPVHSEDLSEPVTSEKARDSEGTIYKEETEEEENSSETSLVVQKSDDNEKSTKYSNNRLEVDAAAGLEDASKIDELDTKSEVEINDVDIGNGHSAVIQSPPIKARNSSSRGRKRKSAGDTETRGRPASARKEKHPVTYQSQISPDQNGIKIRIKKSSTATTKVQRTNRRGRKRRGKKGSNTDDEISTDSESNKRVRWGDAILSEGDDVVGDNEEENNGEQSVWGERMPTEILGKIFLLCTQEEGCLPFLIRMARVCKLWRDTAVAPYLWHTIDFSLPYVKQKYKNVDHFRWLCENRLRKVQELSMGAWKHYFYQQAMDLVAEYCPDLKGLNLMGWKGLLPEHLKNVLANCQQLARLDLSYINSESSTSKGLVSPVSISHLLQTLGSKLTHLILANNKLAGIPNLITAISTHCPNLEVFDLSNVRTYAHTSAPLHIEKLQEGCQKLRVLRVTNSQITLSTASLKEQVASPGFPALEELSVAGTSIDGMCFTTVIDDNAIERILKTSQKLRLLDVRGCVRVTDSSLVRVPAWDLEHLFLSGCYVTRLSGSGLELIAQKWSHSLIEVDLAWSTATEALDLAVSALAERGAESPLRVLNLCGSSVSFNPVKAVLMHCPNLISLNLSSCRALPRGIKRLYEGRKVSELRESLEERSEAEKAKEEEKTADEEDMHENEAAQAECGSVSSGTVN